MATFKLRNLTPVGFKIPNYPTSICQICRGPLLSVCIDCEEKNSEICDVTKSSDGNFYHMHCTTLIKSTDKKPDTQVNTIRSVESDSEEETERPGVARGGVMPVESESESDSGSLTPPPRRTVSAVRAPARGDRVTRSESESENDVLSEREIPGRAVRAESESGSHSIDSEEEPATIRIPPPARIRSASPIRETVYDTSEEDSETD